MRYLLIALALGVISCSAAANSNHRKPNPVTTTYVSPAVPPKGAFYLFHMKTNNLGMFLSKKSCEQAAINHLRLPSGDWSCVPVSFN